VSTPSNAKAGRSPLIDVVLLDGVGNSYVVPIGLNIIQTYAVDISASNPQGMGVPNGVVTYHMAVLNEGNGEDIFVLEHDDLPGNMYNANFYDADGHQVTSITLAGGEREDIELRVFIPKDANLIQPVDLLVRATSTSAKTDEVKLMLDVRLPDLQILSVEYDPAMPTDARLIHVTIQIANDGSFRAENVEVVMMEDGKELGRELVETLDEGSIATVIFQWTPSAGKHTLTYQVSTDVSETDYENNELVHRRTVEDDEPVPGFGRWAVLLVIVCVVIATRFRRLG